MFNKIDALGELKKVIDLPGYYLGVNADNPNIVNLFKEDQNIPGLYDELIKIYDVEDYNSETLEELKEEILNDIKNIENKEELENE